MYFKLFILGFIFFFTSNIHAQSYDFTSYEKGIQVRSAIDAEQSLFFNPSGLANSEDKYLSLNYTTRFNLTDLQSINVGFVLPSKYGVFAFTLSQFGNTDFNQKNLSLSYGKKLFEKLNLGVRFNGQQNQVVEFDSYNQITFDVGVSSQLTKSVLISAYVSNPIQSKLGEQVSGFELIVGGKWVASTKAEISFEVAKNNTFKPLDIRLGLLYNIHEKFSIYTGVSTGKTSIGLGVKYKIKKFDIFATSNYSYNLGFQPSIGVGRKF